MVLKNGQQVNFSVTMPSVVVECVLCIRGMGRLGAIHLIVYAIDKQCGFELVLMFS